VIKAADELTKNHRENDRTSASGVMPEMGDHPLCPVTSYERYLAKLHPESNCLWQRPRDTYLESDPTWYCNARVGAKSLSTFLSNLSTSCKLSTVYTNHSLRATGITLLSRSGFNFAQICAVSGHKSVSSLAVYQRVDTDEKVRMGQAIAASLVDKPPLLALPLSSVNLALPAPPQMAPVLTAEQAANNMAGVEIDQLLGDFEGLSSLPLQSITNTVSNRSMSAQMPVFHNCRIGNININIQK
jgi:hypothetical protein